MILFWVVQLLLFAWRTGTKVEKGRQEHLSFQSSQLTSTQQSVSCHVHPFIHCLRSRLLGSTQIEPSDACLRWTDGLT